MLIAEFSYDHPVLRETLRRCPHATIEWEYTNVRSDGPMQMLAWITSENFSNVEAAIDDDPTVAHPTMLVESAGRRLYRVTYTNESQGTSLSNVMIDAGGVPMQATGTAAGWKGRARFSSRDGLQQFDQYLERKDIDHTFTRIYETANRLDVSGPSLTEAQRATLDEALDSGYLEIPRECTLAELGERLGISESAASERFRRAVKALARDTR